MAFKYDRLWSLIDSHKISKQELRALIGASQTTLVSLGKNKSVSLSVINKICKELKCQPEDIMEYVPDEQTEVITNYKCGDIYYADLSGNDGGELGGVRPVIIIQHNVANKYAPTVVVVPLTTLIRKNQLSTHILIKKDNKNKLTEESVVMVEQIRVIDKRRIRGKLGVINSDILEDIKNSLLFLIGIIEN